MFPAFVQNPQNCRYEGQDADEKIILLLRAHPITNLSWIFFALAIFSIPFWIPSAIHFFNLDFSFVPPTFLLVLLIINYLLVLVIMFEGFLGWYFNVNIVTDRRIVDVDFNSLLHRNIDLAPLTSVEETSSNMGGILKAIFHYGDVHVQTAGSKLTIEFVSVPDPHKVSDIILDLLHHHKKH